MVSHKMYGFYWATLYVCDDSSHSISYVLIGFPWDFHKKLVAIYEMLNWVSDANYSQWRSQEGARGQLSPKLPSCPQTNSFEIFWLQMRLIHPRMSQFGVQTQHYSARFTRTIVLYPIFIAVALSVIVMVSWVRWPVTIAPPPKIFSRPPNRRSLATCLITAGNCAFRFEPH